MTETREAARAIASPSRLEAFDKVTGRARYTCDIALPGQLYAGILRSRHAHARVLEVGVDSVLRVPGVRDVLTAADTREITWYEEEAPLFAEHARFVGDEIAAVAADSEEAVIDALRAFEVDYEPDACAADIDAATADGAPAIHAHAPGNLAGEPECYARGDIDQGLAEADTVVEATFTTPAAVHNALEPHASVASFNHDGLNLWVSTQGLFAVREGVAGKLGLPVERVRVIAEHVGGGFGAKQVAWKDTIVAALLAKRTGRPVRVVLDRRAENLAAGHRNATRQRIRLGARRDGRLTAIEVSVDVEIGAYTIPGERSIVAGCYRELYACPNVWTEERRIYTNTGPAVAFRAPGYAEGLFALEQAMDEIARKLAIDPIELRELNYAVADPVDGLPYSSPAALSACYERVRATRRADDAPGARRDEAPSGREARGRHVVCRGRGFAAGIWLAGGPSPPAQAAVSIDHGGRATVTTGVQDIGTGTRTALAQIAADVLDLPIERVRVELGDTGLGLRAPTSSGSTTLATLGPAVRAAAQDARRQAERGARGSATAPIVGRGAARAAPRGLAVRTFAACEAHVEVDLETAEITVAAIVCAPDCGLIVNGKLATSQVIGGVTQGLGFALTEARIVDSKRGLVLNANLEDYLVPTMLDVPPIEHAAVDVPDFAVNELGIKGLGEPPIIAVAPAIANAVHDALGVRVRDLPIDRRRLLEALRAGTRA